MEQKQIIVNRACHMRFNKRTGTYSVVRGTSYTKSLPVRSEALI